MGHVSEHDGVVMDAWIVSYVDQKSGVLFGVGDDVFDVGFFAGVGGKGCVGDSGVGVSGDEDLDVAKGGELA